MTTRKSKAIEREPMLAAGRTPGERVPRAGARRDSASSASSASPAIPTPALRLVSSAKSTRESTASTASSLAPTKDAPGLASAVVASGASLPLPLRFPRPVVAHSAALAAPTTSMSPLTPLTPLPSMTPIPHADPPRRRPRAAASAASVRPLARPVAHSAPAAHAPRRPSVRARFGELREALAEGFEIVQPIFARPLWSVCDDSTTAFNFVLRREHTTRLVTVPEGRTVQRFIRERQLLVDYRG